jgi:hypothetical protein
MVKGGLMKKPAHVAGSGPCADQGQGLRRKIVPSRCSPGRHTSLPFLVGLSDLFLTGLLSDPLVSGEMTVRIGYGEREEQWQDDQVEGAEPIGRHGIPKADAEGSLSRPGASREKANAAAEKLKCR